MDKWERLRKSLNLDVTILEKLISEEKSVYKRLKYKGRLEQSKLNLSAMEGLEVQGLHQDLSFPNLSKRG